MNAGERHGEIIGQYVGWWIGFFKWWWKNWDGVDTATTGSVVVGLVLLLLLKL